jgi:hypothetical protein
MPASKPSNATWIASASIDAHSAEHPLEVPEHRFASIEVRWYSDPDTVKIEFKDAGPAVISKAFLPGDGRNVIVEIRKA